MALTVLYVHYAEDHLPKSNGRENKYITLSLSGFYDVIRTWRKKTTCSSQTAEKNSQVDEHRRKKVK